MPTTWVLIADSERARLFEAESPHGTLREFSDLVHLESRLRPRKLAQDEPGTTHDSHGQGVHGMGTRHSPREQEAIRFAHEIAGVLEKAHNTQSFDRLVVAAGPDFLGLLRAELSKGVRAAVVHEVHKELGHLPKAEEIRRHLPERL
jgi:protein required for attachment to host cells